MKKNSASELLPLWDDLLRDYQKRAVILTREGFRQGAKALLLVLPTGTGKTRTAVCLPREGARVMVVCGQDDLVMQWRDSIKHLRRRAAAIEQTKENVPNSFGFLVGRYSFFIPFGEAVDVDAEKEKIQKEIQHITGFLKSVQGKLSNERFVGNAPESVVVMERKKESDELSKLDVLNSKLKDLG